MRHSAKVGAVLAALHAAASKTDDVGMATWKLHYKAKVKTELVERKKVHKLQGV